VERRKKKIYKIALCFYKYLERALVCSPSSWGEND